MGNGNGGESSPFSSVFLLVNAWAAWPHLAAGIHMRAAKRRTKAEGWLRRKEEEEEQGTAISHFSQNACCWCRSLPGYTNAILPFFLWGLWRGIFSCWRKKILFPPLPTKEEEKMQGWFLSQPNRRREKKRRRRRFSLTLATPNNRGRMHRLRPSPPPPSSPQQKASKPDVRRFGKKRKRSKKKPDRIAPCNL